MKNTASLTAAIAVLVGTSVWNVHQHLAGGSVIDWSDKPGSAEKPSITKITAAAASSAAH